MGFECKYVNYKRANVDLCTCLGKVPECQSELLRDLLFILQGIDGQRVKFLRPKVTVHSSLEAPLSVEAGVKVDDKVPQPTQDLIHQLSELGWLFRRVSSALNDPSRKQRGGLTLQSLDCALERELKDYYRLIATLESRSLVKDLEDNSSAESLLKPVLLQAEEEQEQYLNQDLDPQDGLTLRRMAVWTANMKLRMRMMSVLVDGSERESLVIEVPD